MQGLNSSESRVQEGSVTAEAARILVVDDDEELLQMLQVLDRNRRSQGYRCDRRRRSPPGRP